MVSFRSFLEIHCAPSINLSLSLEPAASIASHALSLLLVCSRSLIKFRRSIAASLSTNKAVLLLPLLLANPATEWDLPPRNPSIYRFSFVTVMLFSLRILAISRN